LYPYFKLTNQKRTVSRPRHPKNQKPQAARLRHADSRNLNYMHTGTGGALNTGISATLFSDIFANLLSTKYLRTKASLSLAIQAVKFNLHFSPALLMLSLYPKN
jgi:hypothetical protein